MSNTKTSVVVDSLKFDTTIRKDKVCLINVAVKIGINENDRYTINLYTLQIYCQRYTILVSWDHHSLDSAENRPSFYNVTNINIFYDTVVIEYSFTGVPYRNECVPLCFYFKIHINKHTTVNK